MERARALGAQSPDHHLMPFRVTRNSWDLDRLMSNSGIRKPWQAIREAAAVPWLRIHDLRHTAITRMAEAGVPIPVILSMAGHISTRMQQALHFGQRVRQTTCSRGGIRSGELHGFRRTAARRSARREFLPMSLIPPTSLLLCSP